MKIERNIKAEAEIAEFLFEQDDPSPGISVTKLLYCPLKAYYRIKGVKGKTDPISEGIKLSGRAIHAIFDQIAEKAKERYEEIKHEENIIWNDIWGRPDLIIGDKLYEFKTTRKKIFSPKDIPSSWIEQLACYTAILENKIKESNLVIIFLVTGKYNVWKIEFTEEDLIEIKAFMLTRARKLDNALKYNIPESLVEDSPRFDHECGVCEFKEVCHKWLI